MTTVGFHRVGFLGLGVMGQPMALNLARAGTDLIVWNRTPSRTIPLREAGAVVAASAADVLTSADTVILMLANDRVIESVVDLELVAGRTLIHMGTTDPSWSERFGAAVRAAGGSYVEAPVSGSRAPAEAGQLVAMIAGDQADSVRVEALLTPMCRSIIPCGAVPGALLMKLAVNTFLISMVTGLAEAFHFAEQHELDLGTLQAVLEAGPMSSVVSRAKGQKLLSADYTVQASVGDVLYNSRLIVDAASRAGISSPLLDVCAALFAAAAGDGHAGEDMVAVISSLRTPKGLSPAEGNRSA